MSSDFHDLLKEYKVSEEWVKQYNAVMDVDHLIHDSRNGSFF